MNRLHNNKEQSNDMNYLYDGFYNLYDGFYNSLFKIGNALRDPNTQIYVGICLLGCSYIAYSTMSEYYENKGKLNSEEIMPLICAINSHSAIFDTGDGTRDTLIDAKCAQFFASKDTPIRK